MLLDLYSNDIQFIFDCYSKKIEYQSSINRERIEYQSNIRGACTGASTCQVRRNDLGIAKEEYDINIKPNIS